MKLTTDELKAKGDLPSSFCERELSVTVGVKRFADIFRRLTRG